MCVDNQPRRPAFPAGLFAFHLSKERRDERATKLAKFPCAHTKSLIPKWERANVHQDFTVTTAKLPADVLAKLREWASFNLTSVNAELVRACREKAQREPAEKAAR